MKNWIETALSIQKFHIGKMKEDEKWRIEHTATSLKRSIGSVSQYLTIASWLRTHENQIKRCDTMKEAVSWIKDKKREMFLDQ